MAAELRDGRDQVWVVDLACGLEEAFGDDAIGASLRANEHNSAVHGSDPDLSLDPSDWSPQLAGNRRRARVAAH